MNTKNIDIDNARTLDVAIENLKARIIRDDEIRGGWQARLTDVQLTQDWDNERPIEVTYVFTVEWVG